jgi:putative DNA primase/helicase
MIDIFITSDGRQVPKLGLPPFTDYTTFPPLFKEIEEPIFCGFKAYQQTDGKITKIPTKTDGYNASSTDPYTWCTLSEAIEAQDAGMIHGIGIILIEPMTCIDLDGLYDWKTGEFHPVAKDILSTVPGWAEYSVSGMGIHIFGICDTPFTFTAHDWKENGQKRAVEIYQRSRFIALTGNLVEEGV